MKLQLVFFLVTIYSLGTVGRKSKPLRLEKYNVDPSSVTISGFSSGGAQAMQFHLAYSSVLSGAGIFSGVPYMYGFGRMREDFYVTEPDQFNTTMAIELAKNFESQGLLDPLDNLRQSKVYIYHGTKDSTVYHGSGKAIQKIYSYFNPTMLAELDSMPAEHGMPSDNSGGPCGTLNLLNYLVNNCKYNGVYQMFDYLYGGNLTKPEGTVGTVPLTGKLLSFDQTEFFEKGGLMTKSASMDNQGYIYVPSGCAPANGTSSDTNTQDFNLKGSPCKLAFALHGCAQTRQTYGDKFARTTGYLEMAELNDIIVVFPQTKRSLYSPRNPSGCWDWMGFTGKEYGTQKGMQTKVLRKMMARVLGEDL